MDALREYPARDDHGNELFRGRTAGVPIFHGQAITCAIYLEGGIRGVEIGSPMFGTTDENRQHAGPDEAEYLRHFTARLEFVG